jgi:hypothetical protein
MDCPFLTSTTDQVSFKEYEYHITNNFLGGKPLCPKNFTLSNTTCMKDPCACRNQKGKISNHEEVPKIVQANEVSNLCHQYCNSSYTKEYLFHKKNIAKLLTLSQNLSQLCIYKMCALENRAIRGLCRSKS